MPKKKLSDEEKFNAVMDLLESRGTASEICTRYGISQTYLYKLRDRSTAAIRAGIKAGLGKKSTAEGRLEHELDKAKQLIGDQALLISLLKKRER
ncbi:hypothetical protein ACFL6G_08790 [candidate division KSB1 bacterium]